MVKGLADWLSQFRDSSVFSTTVPFTSGTTFGDVFDLSQAFIDRVYSKLVTREIAPTGAQSAEVEMLGRLSSDASFQLQLDDGALFTVVVHAADTASNTRSNNWRVILTTPCCWPAWGQASRQRSPADGVSRFR